MSHQGPLRLRFVYELLERLPSGCRLLDLGGLGCGPGDPATRLLSERFNVVGVGLSPVQVALAKAAAPKAAFVNSDMSQLGLRPAAFDAVVSFGTRLVIFPAPFTASSSATSAGGCTRAGSSSPTPLSQRKGRCGPPFGPRRCRARSGGPARRVEVLRRVQSALMVVAGAAGGEFGTEAPSGPARVALTGSPTRQTEAWLN